MKSFVRVFAAVTLFVLFSTITIQANDRHDKRASLPASVVSARTVYVDNQTTTAELQNTAYTELSKWGRLQIVDTPQKADIVLRLSNGNYVKFVPGGENPPASKPKDGNQNVASADEAVPPGSTRISVIDPKTGNSLWSDIRNTDNAKAATHMLDGLREAFAQKKNNATQVSPDLHLLFFIAKFSLAIFFIPDSQSRLFGFQLSTVNYCIVPSAY